MSHSPEQWNSEFGQRRLKRIGEKLMRLATESSRRTAALLQEQPPSPQPEESPSLRLVSDRRDPE